MKGLFKYTFKFLKVFFAVIFLLVFAAFIFIVINKKKIIRMVKEEINQELRGELSTGEIDISFLSTFPRASVRIRNISLTDSMYSIHQHPFLKCEEAFITFNIFKLIKKDPPVSGVFLKNGTIYLYTDSAGYTNNYLLKSKKEPASKTSEKEISVKNIVLTGMTVIIDDRRKNKFHEFAVNDLRIKLKDQNNVVLCNTRSDILVKSFAFNLNRGSFLKRQSFNGKFLMKYEKDSHRLLFDSIGIKIGGHPFHLSAMFELKGPSPQFSLTVRVSQITYAFVKTLLPSKIANSLSIVETDKPIDGTANVSGPLKGGEPLLNISFETKNAGMKTPFFDFDSATFKGYYTNEVTAGQPRNDPNSRIVFKEFSASWHGLPVSSPEIDINNLFEPVLTCRLSSDFPLVKLNDILSMNLLILKKGDCSVRLNYNGPIERNINTNSLIDGSLSFRNALITYAPRNVDMKNIFGKITFRNADVFISNLQTDVFNNSITMNGEALKLLTLINTNPERASISWNVNSPSPNLEDFVFLLKERKSVGSLPKDKQPFGEVANRIDKVLDFGRLQLNFRSDLLTYRKFESRDVRANITLLRDRYIINNVSFGHGGGQMLLNGSLTSTQKKLHRAAVNVHMNNVDVNTVFEAFENFGQDGIKSENLVGNLTATVSASMDIDETGKVVPTSVVSEVDFSLKNGELNNFEPVKKLQKFIFKNRDFENIRFAELKDHLSIANQEIRINRMEIQSSVMTLFVEGVYSQKGTTDISIQVPLSNLNKRKREINPENIGQDKKAGSSIFVRGRPGSDGNISFKLDLFNKYKKEKKKNKEKQDGMTAPF